MRCRGAPALTDTPMSALVCCSAAARHGRTSQIEIGIGSGVGTWWKGDPAKLEAAIEKAKASGLSDQAVAASEAKLAEMRAKEQKDAEAKALKEAQAELKAAQPTWFKAADLTRLQSAIDAAREAGVAEATVAAAEGKLTEQVDKELKAKGTATKVAVLATPKRAPPPEGSEDDDYEYYDDEPAAAAPAAPPEEKTSVGEMVGVGATAVVVAPVLLVAGVGMGLSAAGSKALDLMGSDLHKPE